MPTVKANEITLYYEIHGAGEPLLLISGLNSDHTLYRTIMPRLAEKYQVIIFDNRGVGQSDKPDVPYTIEMMADDTAGLLRELGIERAHILGASMGGRIAADLALRYPQLVKSLILVSTGMKRLKDEPMTFHRRLIAWQLRLPMVRGKNPYYAVKHQLEASRSYDCMDRLGEIQMPTLILHGKNDKTAPYALAEAMHHGIKGSQMQSFPGGHIFFIFHKSFVEAVMSFLSKL